MDYRNQDDNRVASRQTHSHPLFTYHQKLAGRALLRRLPSRFRTAMSTTAAATECAQRYQIEALPFDNAALRRLPLDTSMQMQARQVRLDGGHQSLKTCILWLVIV